MDTIGSWQFDAELGVLHRGEVEISLENRSARVLEALCRRRGEIVSKNELLTEVWGGRSVSSNSVAIVIGDLRRALGDPANEPVHIVTIGKRGYRLTAGVQELVAEPPRTARRHFGLVIVTALAIVLFGSFVMFTAASRPIDLVVLPVQNETGRVVYDGLSRSLSAVVMDRAVRFSGVRVLGTDTAQEPRASAVILRSRLILWNGSPELAITAVRSRTRSVLWSTFATGDLQHLAKDVALKLNGLQRPLASSSTIADSLVL